MRQTKALDLIFPNALRFSKKIASLKSWSGLKIFNFSDFRIFFLKVGLAIACNIEIQQKVAQNDVLGLESSNLPFKNVYLV